MGEIQNNCIIQTTSDKISGVVELPSKSNVKKKKHTGISQVDNTSIYVRLDRHNT